MKYAKRQLIFFIGYLIVGAILATAAMLWSPINQKSGVLTGIIGGFLPTGIGGIILSCYMLRKPHKAEQIEIAKTEERAQFIRLKTHASLYFITIILICLGTFAALISGNTNTALTLAGLLIVEVLFYVGFAAYYLKKY
jgi:amino acid permease